MGFKNILVVGGGAIGAITTAVLHQKGEHILVVDADTEHVKRMNRGLEITGFRELTIPINAVTPEELIVFGRI